MSYLDWMPSDDGDNNAVAVYEYTDEAGELLFGVSRNASKEFRQWRPDAAKSNGRRWSLKGDDGKLAVRLVLYRLPRVLAAIERGEPVFVCEGEKDVHALEAAGVTATCNPMGAGKWDAAYAESLHGAHAVIVADKDAPGWAHLRTVVTALEPVTASLRAVCAAEGKDAADHLGAGHGLGDFEPLDLAAPPGWTAPDPAAATAQDGRAPAQDGRLAEVAARYVPVDWETAWKGQPDKVEWIREPLLERGTVNALFAEAGTGKSLLTLEICLGAVQAKRSPTWTTRTASPTWSNVCRHSARPPGSWPGCACTASPACRRWTPRKADRTCWPWPPGTGPPWSCSTRRRGWCPARKTTRTRSFSSTGARWSR